ncbi:MAG TPA: hypothetical protein VNW97_08050 [Candidatus Saccharimonadales bacterium]|nr:hypothetical protein [Candidatus Saccharimonadales bacterium]
MTHRNLGKLQNKAVPVARREGSIPGFLLRLNKHQFVDWLLQQWDGARRAKLHSIFHRVTFRAIEFLLGQEFWSPSVREILLEFRSFLGRIQRLRETNASLLGDFGPVWITLSSGHHQRCEATLARILDTQDMRANHPEATIIDVDRFLEGWIKGARWAVCGIRSSGNGTEHTENLASENVIQQIEALQAPKHGGIAHSSGS